MLQVMFSPLCIAACLVVAGKLEERSPSSLTSQTLQLGGRLGEDPSAFLDWRGRELPVQDSDRLYLNTVGTFGVGPGQFFRARSYGF